MTVNYADALLEDILEHPGDNTPRLVYADWLDDNGDPERAGFIRLQIRMAAGAASDDDTFAELGLLEAHGGRWAAPLAEVFGLVGRSLYGYGGGFGVSWEWRRGFVTKIALTLADFEAHAAAIFSAHPVEEVVLTDRKPYPAELLITVHDNSARYPGWYLLRGGDNDRPRSVPEHLFRWLNPARRYTSNWADYYSTADALADLSRACVAHGREKGKRLRTWRR